MQRMNRPLFVFALLALGGATFALAPGTVRAQSADGGRYDVEVIIFRGNGGSREDGAGRGAPPARSAAEATSNGPARAARYLGPLPAAKWRLNDLKAKLVAGGYKPLLHVAWTQSSASWGSRAGLTLEQLGVNVDGLSGNFLLERGSLLHFGLNLRYAADANATPQQFNEIRRVRFGETQYYDHPTLGAIAVVTPAGK
jgi:hypothetical protein